MSLRTVVLLSGTGTNFQALLDAVALGSLDLEILAAVSDRIEAQGLELARRAGVSAYGIARADYPHAQDWWEVFSRRLESLAPDVLVLAGFMRILPRELCARHAGRILNIHPSLLPRYPGLHTYRRVLEAGDSWHGTSVHFVTRHLDSGPLIAQARIPVGPNDTEDSLKSRVQACEHVLYPRVLDWMSQGSLILGERHAVLDGRELIKPIVFEEQELL